MTLRLIYSRPMAVYSANYLASDRPQPARRPSLLHRLVRLVLEAMHRSRARAAARVLRRYRHLIHRDDDADKS
jgi:hypothetical protein